MFSREVNLTMADGSTKSIADIKQNDWILNKLHRPCRVKTIKLNVAQPAYSIQLANGTVAFYASPDTKVFSTSTNGGSKVASYQLLSTVATNSDKLKTDSKMFSPYTDVAITAYDATIVSKDLYTIDTYESSKTFVVVKNWVV
jgi:hypothetical protein